MHRINWPAVLTVAAALAAVGLVCYLDPGTDQSPRFVTTEGAVTVIEDRATGTCYAVWSVNAGIVPYMAVTSLGPVPCTTKPEGESHE